MSNFSDLCSSTSPPQGGSRVRMRVLLRSWTVCDQLHLQLPRSAFKNSAIIGRWFTGSSQQKRKENQRWSFCELRPKALEHAAEHLTNWLSDTLKPVNASLLLFFYFIVFYLNLCIMCIFNLFLKYYSVLIPMFHSSLFFLSLF